MSWSSAPAWAAFPELRTYEADMTAYGFAAVRESAHDGAERSHQNPLPTVFTGERTVPFS